MREIILFIASSLDSFIAGPNGEIDWLYTDGDYGYNKFYDSIDTTLTGNNTYKTIPGNPENPFPGKENYIFTRNGTLKGTPGIKYISGDIAGFTKDLRNKPGKNIWLVGGGQINTILLNENLIDRIILSIHPIVLGSGIPMFAAGANTKHFRTVGTERFESGLIQIELEKVR